MMKRFLLAWGVLAVAGAGVVRAQTVEFELQLSHATYVVGEPIDFTLHLADVGSTPVVVDTVGPYAQNRLFLEISAPGGKKMDPLGSPELIDSLMLAPGEVFRDTFYVDDLFPILRQGTYYLRAKLILGDRLYETNLKTFSVVPGITLATAVQPIPDRPGHLRELHLVYLARARREFLFLRCLDDGGEQTSPTLRLGPVVRITKPTLSLSPDGTITVRHQATRNRFQETRIRSDADGLRVMEEQQKVNRKSSLLLDAILPPEPDAPEPPARPASPAARRTERPADGW
ncbi:MAG: hypothetical protein ACOX5G_13425 [Kiritimatiellia bacterium]